MARRKSRSHRSRRHQLRRRTSYKRRQTLQRHIKTFSSSGTTTALEAMRNRFRAAVEEDPPTIRAYPRYPTGIVTAFVELGEWIQYWQHHRSDQRLSESPEITFKIDYTNDLHQEATFKLKVQKGAVDKSSNRPLDMDGTVILPTQLFFKYYIDGEDKGSSIKTYHGYREEFFNHFCKKYPVQSIPDGTITYEAVL